MKKTLSILFCSVLLSGLLLVDTAQAADPKPTIRDDAYSARYVSQSIPDPIVIEAGATKTVDIRFKNVGTATWKDGTTRYISAYTMEPRYRTSPFISGRQTAKIAGPVAPGEVGTLSIPLTAPKEVGEYTEEFYLASENYSWVEGGYFFLKIKVVEAKAPAVETPASDDARSAEESDSGSKVAAMKGKRIGQTKKTVSAVGGDEVNIKLMFQNTGTSDWDGYRLIASVDGEDDAKTIADSDWKAANVVLETDDSVDAGKVVRPAFSFRMPADKGSYVARFDIEGIEGAEAMVKLTVTEDAPRSYKAPKVAKKVEVKEQKPVLKEEPRIRVGLTGEGSSIQVVSYDDDYRVIVDGKEKGILKRKKLALISHITGVYTLSGGGLRIATEGVIRLEPINDPHATFQVTKGLKDRRIAWVGDSDFITYHGAVEYRQGEKDKKMYVVNDVLLDDYVAGIAETGKHYDIEAIKANLVAARTYAYMSRGKYPFFDLVGSTYDQLYLGAEVAKHMPKVPVAAKETRGEMVSYNGDVVITPYFGNSNGKTRSWRSVWGGSNKPWLVPVVASHDQGRRQFGHGVGMSQRDMALKADKDNWDYDQILGHFYTDTDLTLMYK